jgi:hypothetical protein
MTIAENGAEAALEGSRAPRRCGLLKTRGTIAIIGTGLTVAVAAGLVGCASPDANPSSTASPDASPSVSGTTTIGPDGMTLAGRVTVEPFLPDALPLPTGIWDRTGPGWVLATYLPSWTDMNSYTIHTLDTQVVYLVSPDGTRYQVAELDPAQPLWIDSWSAGESTAFVRACWDAACMGGTGDTMILDLNTGTLSTEGVPFSGGWVRTTLAGHVRVWDIEGQDPVAGFIEHDGAFMQLGEDGMLPGDVSPGGTWIIAGHYWGDGIDEAGVYSMATGEPIALPSWDGVPCYAQRWEDDDHVVVSCGTDTRVGSGFGDYDPDAPPPEVRPYRLVDLSTGASTATTDPWDTENGGLAWRIVSISPHVWAGYQANGSSMPGIEDHGLVRELTVTAPNGDALDGATARASVDSVLYLEGYRMYDYDSNSFSARIIFTQNLVTGTKVLLLPEPSDASTPELTPRADTTVRGVTSWVVAP